MQVHTTSLVITLLPLLLLGCPVERPDETLEDPGHDWDGDGYCEIAPCLEDAEGGDCNDDDPTIHPDADEGCDGLDTDCDGALGSTEIDGDGDGVMGCQGDCNDEDAAVHPGADEQCNGHDDDCDGSPDSDEVDADGDGVMVCSNDCNDGDAYIYPGADEVCNGEDDDCDGSPGADEVDSDGDTWMVCEGDCDDGDGTSYPGATEVCDGADNDCDGSLGADEGDADGDSSMVCQGDCNDGNASVYPGAPEVCDGVLDNDCDGVEDPDEIDDDTDGLTECEGDCNDSDNQVHPGAVEQCNGVDDDCDGALDADEIDDDGDGWMVCEGDCDDDEALANPGEVETCNDWIDNDCDGTDNGCGMHGEIDLSLGDAKLTGESSGDQAGIAVAGGDIDGDGLSDILVGAWYDDSGGTDAGAVYVVYGPVSGDYGLSLADAKLIGEAASDYAGHSIDCPGDVDGDGNDDILIGASGVDDAGGAYLLYGPVNGNLDLSGADASFHGETAGDAMGFSVSGAGDVNNDGFADVLLGAHHESSGGEHAGAAYLLHGPLYGTIDLSIATAKFVGEEVEDKAGISVSGAGDVDGDGYDDILVGAYQNDTGEAGKAYLVYGPASGTIDLSTADAILLGEAGHDSAGMSVSTAGDVDGDGFDDFLVGAYGHDAGGSGAGAAYLLHGPVYGTLDLSAADTTFIGEASGDFAGYSVSAGGDLDGDGLDDLVVGAKRQGAGGYHAGAAYLVYSVALGDVDLSLSDAKLVGEEANDGAGYAIAPAGDVDGDGYDDMLVGAHGNGNGAAYLLLGGGI